MFPPLGVLVPLSVLVEKPSLKTTVARADRAIPATTAIAAAPTNSEPKTFVCLITLSSRCPPDMCETTLTRQHYPIGGDEPSLNHCTFGAKGCEFRLELASPSHDSNSLQIQRL